MQKVTSILILLLLSSCLSSLNEERIKTIEASAASNRINSVDQNSRSAFDEIE